MTSETRVRTLRRDCLEAGHELGQACLDDPAGAVICVRRTSEGAIDRTERIRSVHGQIELSELAGRGVQRLQPPCVGLLEMLRRFKSEEAAHHFVRYVRHFLAVGTPVTGHTWCRIEGVDATVGSAADTARLADEDPLSSGRRSCRRRRRGRRRPCAGRDAAVRASETGAEEDGGHEANACRHASAAGFSHTDRSSRSPVIPLAVSNKSRVRPMPFFSATASRV
jgi:hypothetical protein